MCHVCPHITYIIKLVCSALQDAPAAEGEDAAGTAGEAQQSSPKQQQQPNRLAQCLAIPMQPLGSGIHSPSKQLQSPGRFASPRPKTNGVLAMTSAPNSQATSGPDADADEGESDAEDEGEEDEGEAEGSDEQQQAKQGGKGGRRRGNQASSSTPNRPKRIRKPKQYLGEDTQTTPTRHRRGSLPTTPASAGRRPVSVSTMNQLPCSHCCMCCTQLQSVQARVCFMLDQV